MTRFAVPYVRIAEDGGRVLADVTHSFNGSAAAACHLCPWRLSTASGGFEASQEAWVHLTSTHSAVASVYDLVVVASAPPAALLPDVFGAVLVTVLPSCDGTAAATCRCGAWQLIDELPSTTIALDAAERHARTIHADIYPPERGVDRS